MPFSQHANHRGRRGILASLKSTPSRIARDNQVALV